MNEPHPPTTTLPPYLMTSELGSFARSTIVERKPQIIAQVIDENEYPAEVVRDLEAFKQEIAGGLMQPLREAAPDVDDWNSEWVHCEGQTWLDLPWYFAETYFYRRLLEAVRYLQPGLGDGLDPFDRQKRRQEALAIERLAETQRDLDGLGSGDAFEVLLHSALWGNRVDLSNFTVREQARSGLAAQHERENVLINHTERVRGLLANGVAEVGFVTDNVGLDLLFDLVLADFLIRMRWAQRAVFHLKNRPFFVSDAMPRDAELFIELLQAASAPAVAALGRRLDGHRSAGRLRLVTDPFWSSFRMFPDLPSHLRVELSRADLLICKGDVNYRRLLDDRHWPHATPFEAIADRFDLPRPFVAVRTLKGEIMVGLQPGEAEQIAVQDPTWLINGRRGVIHLVTRS